MARYRMKPVEKEAWKISDILDPLADLDAAVSEALSAETIIPVPNGLSVVTLEGTMTGHANDYLVRGLTGEFYPVQKAIFEASYEAI